MKLSEYNDLAKALGYQQETIENEGETLLIPGVVSQKHEFKNGDYKKSIEVIQGEWTKDISSGKSCRKFGFYHMILEKYISLFRIKYMMKYLLLVIQIIFIFHIVLTDLL